MTLREAAAFGRSLARATSQAEDPVTAVKAWLRRFLDAFYEPRRAERTMVLTSAAFTTSRPSAQVSYAMKRIACEPLIAVLRTGHESGALYSPTPEADAYSIHDLVTAIINVNSILDLPAAGRVDGVGRATTQAHVMRFAWPALRLGEESL